MAQEKRAGPFNLLRMDDAEDVVILPFYGEFGWMVMQHVRYVHAHPATSKVVCCPPGHECLYPSATAFFTAYDEPLPDAVRCVASAYNGGRSIADLDLDIAPRLRAAYPGHRTVRPEYDCPWHMSDLVKPKLTVPAGPYDPVDVVIAPRRRHFVPNKNYPHWQPLIDALRADGFRVGSIGGKDTSFANLTVDARAWDHPLGGTAGSVDMLARCKHLFVGSDTGTAHLAALMDVPSVVMRREEPGNPDYRSIMVRANRRRTVSLPERMWDEPEGVRDAVYEAMAESPDKPTTPASEKVAEPASPAGVPTDGEFAAAIRKVIAERKPMRLIETGTHDGRGTTRVIDNALWDAFDRDEDPTLVTIEVNPELFVKARAVNRRNRVVHLCGLSLPEYRVPTREETRVAVARATRDGVTVDYGGDPNAYAREVASDGDDDLLGFAVRHFEGRPDFVLLDSAGHVGYVEFLYLLELLKHPCVIALDDVNHLKHHMSLAYAEKSHRFHVLEKGTERHGWAILQYNPGGDE